MTVRDPRSSVQKVIGFAALGLLIVFAGNIILAKLSVELGFSMPRLPARIEFALLLVATGLGVLFITKEERRQR